MTFFDERGAQISATAWLKKYEAYYFLTGPTWSAVNPRNQSSRFVEDKICALLTQSRQLSKGDLVLLMAWKLSLIDHVSSDRLQEVVFAQNFDKNLISRQYRALNFSRSIPYLAANMPQIVQRLAQNPQYLVDWVRGPHPELDGFGITYILTVQFFITHGRDPIYDKFAHMGAIAIHQGLKPGTPIRWAPVQDWSEYLGYVNLLKPISADCSESTANSSMTVPRHVDRALWVYGHFFQELKAAQSRRMPSVISPSQLPKGSQMAGGSTSIRCLVYDNKITYSDGLQQVVLAVLPGYKQQVWSNIGELRIGTRIDITLSTKVGDFEAGVRAWSSTSDRPYICPDLRSKRTQQKERLARVLKECGIRTGSEIDVAVAGRNWKIAASPSQ